MLISRISILDPLAISNSSVDYVQFTPNPIMVCETVSCVFLPNFKSFKLTAEELWAIQSQKTQGFCVADFATLSDERRSR